MNLALLLCLLSALLALLLSVFSRPNWLKYGSQILRWGAAGTLGALVVSLVLRGIELQRFPLANLFDSLLFLALGILAAFLLLERRFPEMHWLAVWIFGLVTLVLFYANLLPESQKAALPLIPALRSYWRIVHVPPLLFAYAFFLLAGLGGGAYLFSLQRNKNTTELLEEPSRAERYLQYMDRCISLGFPLLTFGIITGALWANQSWGGLWQWDPKENLALGTWFCYAIYLHLSAKGQTSPQILAWLSIMGVAATYLTYLGINQLGLGGLHTYGKV